MGTKDDMNKHESRSTARRTVYRKKNRYTMDDRNYDSVNISALKRMNEDIQDFDDVGNDTIDSEDDWEKKKLSRKKRKAFDEEEEEEVAPDDDDDDDEEGFMINAGRKRNRQAVIDEDDD